MNFFSDSFHPIGTNVGVGPKNLLSIIGLQAYNTNYFKKKFHYINDEFLTKLNLDSKRFVHTRSALKSLIKKHNRSVVSSEEEDFFIPWYKRTLKSNKDVVFNEDKPISNIEEDLALSYGIVVGGFKIYLNNNYFDEGLEDIKQKFHE